MNFERISFHALLRGKIGHSLECFNIFGTAIRITRVVQRIHTDKNIRCIERLGPGQSERKKYGIGMDVFIIDSVLPFGTGISSVNAEPPMEERSIFKIKCLTTLSEAVIFFAASNSW